MEIMEDYKFLKYLLPSISTLYPHNEAIIERSESHLFFALQIQEVNYLANNTYLLLRFISGKLEIPLNGYSKYCFTALTWGSSEKC